MKERMAKAVTSKITENTLENQLESVDNLDVAKLGSQNNYQRRLSRSVKRYQLEQQL